MRFNIALTALAATAIAAAPASANGPVNATDFAKQVQHDDVDLTTQEGIALLDDRMQIVIRRMCANGGRDGASIRLERECRSSAAASAEQQVRLAIATAKSDKVRLASAKPVAPEA